MAGGWHPDLERAMSKPDFYPEPAARVERKETHISLVFLTNDRVYKVKKPVSLEFLDFSSLDKRHRACRREVELNRRLTDGVYEGVVSITESGGRLALDGPGPPVEYAVKMRRLDDGHTLARLLARSRLSTADLERLADKLAVFYRNAPSCSHLGGVETVRENCEENFRQMAPFEGRIISPPRFGFLKTAARDFLHRRSALFEERLADGAVREGHGDLRAEHVYFTAGGIQIIDCIEFNERMRVNDVASDMAFLVMDLDYLGASGAAADVLAAFVSRIEDLRIFSLIDFYLCYRACVRLKVTCFRLEQESLDRADREALLERSRSFAELATGYAARFSAPTVYVVMGMIAAGKSTVAGALADALAADVLSSDRIRKQLFENRADGGPETGYGRGRYRPEARRRVYGKMLLSAQAQIRKGRSVVLDATFGGKKERAEALRTAREGGAKIVFVECVCPEAVIRKRLEKREGTDSESDARLSILEQFQKNYAAPEELPATIRLRVDTTGPAASSVCAVYLDSRQIYEDRFSLSSSPRGGIP